MKQHKAKSNLTKRNVGYFNGLVAKRKMAKAVTLQRVKKLAGAFGGRRKELREEVAANGFAKKAVTV